MLNYVKGQGWVEEQDDGAITEVTLYNGYVVKAYDREPKDGESFIAKA